jgi:hypothetical protein
MRRIFKSAAVSDGPGVGDGTTPGPTYDATSATITRRRARKVQLIVLGDHVAPRRIPAWLGSGGDPIHHGR